MDLKVEIVPEATGRVNLPKYQTSGSAGFDIEAFVPEGSVGISAVGTIVRTGLKFDIPKGYELQIRPRSGLAFKHNITLVNSPGTVDSDYTGEVLVKLINLVPTSRDFMIENGTRIAQGVLQPVIQANIISGIVDKQTDRGEGGFGSTDIKKNKKTNKTTLRFVDETSIGCTPYKHKHVLILGAAGSGKDTLGMFLQKNFGLRFKSSSEFANEKVIFPVLGDRYGYKTLEECFNDRINHRPEWFDLIMDYNSEDPTRLTREILKESNIYCGMRNFDEFVQATRENLFDEYIWLERDNCLEPRTSFTITSGDFYELTKNRRRTIIYNNFKTLKEFEDFVKLKFKGVF